MTPLHVALMVVVPAAFALSRPLVEALKVATVVAEEVQVASLEQSSVVALVYNLAADSCSTCPASREVLDGVTLIAARETALPPSSTDRHPENRMVKQLRMKKIRVQ